MTADGVVMLHMVVAVAFFQRVVADDAESYLCYARNKFGSNSATGQLVVLSKIFVVLFGGADDNDDDDDDGGAGGVDDKEMEAYRRRLLILGTGENC